MERYKSIIDNWQSFQEECQKHATAAVRKNPLKAGGDFRERLEREFKDLEQSGWCDDVYRLPGTEKPGASLLHWRGEYYVQEESAAIPVETMEPRPGERILDMCAAPGGKTTQIAAKMGNEGTVVANDSSEKRLRSLQSNVYRTGAACVATTSYDGRSLPEDEKYDRILVDAPCSGEGDRARRTLEAASKDEIENLVKLQKQLVLKAERLLKPGGTMTYSTCTLAPEENEGVVSRLVEETGLELEKIELDLPHQRGIERFEGKEFGPEMSKTVRVYPHHLNSGAIYVARLTK
ncbi:MAG: RsmB/NOP family class I SAM-dependent RNA methyltransferase [Candidatus Nanohaloarchaea archaeon]